MPTFPATRRTALAGLVTLALAAAVAPSTGAAAAAPAPVTQVNDCWSSDNGRPVVDSVTVTPAASDTDAGPVPVQISVQAHDTGGPGPASGVQEVSAELRSQVPYEDFDGPPGSYSLRTRLTRAADGSWQGSVTVPAHTGTTYAATVYALDRADVGTLSDALVSPPLVRENVLTTTGTDPYAGDTVQPTLTHLSLSTTQVDTRRRPRQITVEATGSDDGSGVDQVSVQLLFLAGQRTNGARPAVVLDRVAGTDLFRGSLPFTRWMGNHREVLNVFVTDRAGNVRRYRPPVLADLGFPSRVSVLSGPLNDDAPRVVGVLRAPGSVDVRRQGRWYPVRLVLADPQGVRAARVRLLEDGPVADLHRVSGTARRGVWAGRVRVQRCSPGPVTVPLHVRVVDGQGRAGGREPRAVRLVTADLTRPLATTRWRETPHVFTFSKPVHGISSTNVTVYDDFADDPHPLAVSWSCVGPGGATVDCLSGPVARATFTLDDPGSGNPGIVDWAPEHHLDVLDAHGNPMDVSLAPYVID